MQLITEATLTSWVKELRFFVANGGMKDYHAELESLKSLEKLLTTYTEK